MGRPGRGVDAPPFVTRAVSHGRTRARRSAPSVMDVREPPKRPQDGGAAAVVNMATSRRITAARVPPRRAPNSRSADRRRRGGSVRTHYEQTSTRIFDSRRVQRDFCRAGHGRDPEMCASRPLRDGRRTHCSRSAADIRASLFVAPREGRTDVTRRGARDDAGNRCAVAAGGGGGLPQLHRIRRPEPPPSAPASCRRTCRSWAARRRRRSPGTRRRPRPAPADSRARSRSRTCGSSGSPGTGRRRPRGA